MKKITVLMVAMLAVATTLTAGLTVLPGSVQEAQANPCSVYAGDTVVTGDANDAELNCDFEGIGSLEIDEGGLCCPAATETNDAAATETDDAAQ
jgi:hypothetical protein